MKSMSDSDGKRGTQGSEEKRQAVIEALPCQNWAGPCRTCLQRPKLSLCPFLAPVLPCLLLSSWHLSLPTCQQALRAGTPEDPVLQMG